jgi:hypothetical protein
MKAVSKSRTCHSQSRVCLELHSVVRMKMLYKRWKTLDNRYIMWKSSEQNWPMMDCTRREMNFRRRLSEGVCKSPYAAESGNSFGGERQGKTRTKILVNVC